MRSDLFSHHCQTETSNQCIIYFVGQTSYLSIQMPLGGFLEDGIRAHPPNADCERTRAVALG